MYLNFNDFELFLFKCLQNGISDGFSCHGIDGMSNVLVFPVIGFSARHGDKIALGALDNLDIMHHKALINGYRRHSF